MDLPEECGRAHLNAENRVTKASEAHVGDSPFPLRYVETHLNRTQTALNIKKNTDKFGHTKVKHFWEKNNKTKQKTMVSRE